MKTITLKNEEGDTIEVKRGKGDMILVRHSDKDAEKFGEFNTVEMLAKGPKWEEFVAEEGMDISSELGKKAMEKMKYLAFLVIDGEQILIGPTDGKLISDE